MKRIHDRRKKNLCGAAFIGGILLFAAFWLFGGVHAGVWGAEAPEKREIPGLHAAAACLMDLDTGRVLYGKNEKKECAMASTTKLMTLLVLLEQGNLADTVTISPYAAGQPKVRLGMQPGQQFSFRDLCMSLMLESHNDSAVALAEHVGSGLLGETVEKDTKREDSRRYVEAFIACMNQKAEALALVHTHYVTPNGLDGEDENGSHHSSAEDLCRLLCTVSQNGQFREITGTRSHSFSDGSGKYTYTVGNHNRLLWEMDQCLTGKTGFTNAAGYCYAGAAQVDGKRFAVAVLACGWPPNKNWKWEDVKKLFSYGNENYQKRDVGQDGSRVWRLPVEEGEQKFVKVQADLKSFSLLLAPWEDVKAGYRMQQKLSAPVAAGARVGTYELELCGERFWQTPIYAAEDIGRVSYPYYIKKFFLAFADLG